MVPPILGNLHVLPRPSFWNSRMRQGSRKAVPTMVVDAPPRMEGPGSDAKCGKSLIVKHGYGSIPIHTIFRGMNIYLPAILMFTRGIGFWPIPTWLAGNFLWKMEVFCWEDHPSLGDFPCFSLIAGGYHAATFMFHQAVADQFLSSSIPCFF